MPEARLDDSGSGLAPAGDGWFVVNVRDAEWWTSENGGKQPSGSECAFESQEFWFRQLGIRLHVLEPGEPNGLYHSESHQEGRTMAVRGLAVLVQLAVAELEAVTVASADQEAQANGATLVARPDDVIVLVVLEHGCLARLALSAHLGDPKDSSITPD